jgi:predicted ATP-dependent endonuclease of OLD family
MLPHVYSVQIRNYKSLAEVDVRLGPLAVLVGPNGSGKSNFIDALAFVRQCLVDSIELAFKSRGGIAAVRRRSGGHPTHIGIRLGIRLDESRIAEYAFEIATESSERFRVAHERGLVSSSLGDWHRFEIRDGVFHQQIAGIRSQVASDRLALYAASATESHPSTATAATPSVNASTLPASCSATPS